MRNLKAAGAALGDAILGGTVLDGLEESEPTEAATSYFSFLKP